MRLPSVPTPAMVEHLNTTYFHRVWNAPDDHGRVNFDLRKAARRLQIGVVPLNLSVVGLPTTDTVYAVYQVSANVFGRFVTFVDTNWTTDLEIAELYGVSITTYTTGGRMIPYGKVNLKYDRMRGTVLIAVAQALTSKCTGQSYPDLHMTVFKDTSRQTPTVSKVLTITKAVTGPGSIPAVTAEIKSITTAYPAGTMVYVNGWLYDYNKLPILAVGDIIAIYSDPDIVGYCDLVVDDNETGYYSTLYGEYREVLHIPKVLNPNNYVITNDTLFVGIFDTLTGKGVHGHRLDPHAIESITHNDFSISRTVLQAFQNSLGSQGVFVRLYVRMATKPNPIGREVNLIADLYSLSDDGIQDQLVGISTNQIREWNAAHLEQSAYLNLLYNFDGFSRDTALAEFVQAMGYYDVVSTLAQSLVSYRYDGAAVVIRKPVGLLGYACEAIVYTNGRKLPTEAVHISDECGYSITIGFTDRNYIAPGSIVTVYITEGGERVPRRFSPTLLSPSITLDSEDYDVSRIITYGSDQAVWKGVTRQGHAPLPLSPGDYTIRSNADGTVTFTFSAIHFGKSFYLTPICAMTNAAYDLDDTLANKEAIVIPLTMTDDTGKVLPLMGYRSLEIYLNGYRLIKNIDYSCDAVMGTNNDVLQTLLTVSNNTYLDLQGNGNRLEVVVHSGTVVSQDTGYAIGNMMHRDLPPMVWSKTCGRAFVRGVLLNKVKESGNTIISETDVIDGSPYLTEWTIPYGVAKVLKEISPSRHSDLRVRVSRLMGMSDPKYPETVIINQLYALYSPYLAKIVTDVAKGAFVIKDDPITASFLKQFEPYALLHPRDPTMGTTNPQIDRRFVTLAAHYANLSTQDPQQMILLQRLIGLRFTPSELAIEEVLI